LRLLFHSLNNNNYLKYITLLQYILFLSERF
jgi:hypothetical protein